MRGPRRAFRSFIAAVRNPACGRRGFTLLETLIGIGMFVLVAALFFSVYFSAQESLRRQEEWSLTGRPAVTALDTIRRDLAGAVEIPGKPVMGLSLAAGHDGDGSSAANAAMTLYVAAPRATESARGEATIHLVRYRVRADERGAGGVLVREAREWLFGDRSEPLSAEDLVRGVAGLRVQVHDGREWRGDWPMPGGPALPRAARVTIETGGGGEVKRLETATLMPAGCPPPRPPAAPAGRRPGSGP